MDINVILDICRICMTSEKDVLMSLHSKFSETTISDALASCARLDKIQEDDNMPQNICENCFKELVQAYFFIKRARTSDEILGRLFRCKSTVLLPRIDGIQPTINQTVPVFQTINEVNIDHIQNEIAGTANEQIPETLNFHENPLHIENSIDTHKINENIVDPFELIDEIKEIPSLLPLHEDQSDNSDTENMDGIQDSYDYMENDDEDSNQEKIILEELPIINATDNTIYEAHIKEVKPDGIICCSYKCYKMFPSEEDLHNHVYDKHKSKRYKKAKADLICQKCFSVFSNKSSLEAHMDSIKTEVFLECDICKLRFIGSKQKNIIIHIKNHYKNGTLMKEPTKPVLDDKKIESNIVEIKVEGAVCCSIRCYAVFPDGEEKLMEHAKDVHGRKRYGDNRQSDMKCERCFTIFLNPKQYNRHIYETRNVKKLLECGICKLRFLIHSRNYLRKHINDHFDGNGQLKPAIQPPQPTYNIEELRGLYGFLCCGQGCQLSFATEENLIKHAHKQHLNTKILNEQRADIKPYGCEICFRRFEKIGSLKDHHRRKYIDQHTATACEHCGLKLKRSEFGTHMAKHRDEKQYICDYCGRGFYDKIKIRAHVRTHTALPIYKCNICGDKFKQKTYLNTHMFRHKNIFPFPCSLCSVKCRTKFDLNEHQRVHTGEKPFQCRYCEQYFSDKTNRNVHEIQHTKQFPYNCSTCGKGFTRKSHLVGHKH